MSPLRLLIIVQRYGKDIRGGAEHAARAVAERLAARGHLVEVLTTTAESYVDWSGDLAPGTSSINGVTVHRLTVDPERDTDVFGRLHHRLIDAEQPADPALEHAWIDAQGPSVPDLEPWLEEHAARFDVAVFFTYLYATTSVGLPVAARHTATLLVPCAHDELPLQLRAFDRTAQLADAFAFLTPEEARLVHERFRLRSPEHVVGLGTDLAAEADEAAVKRFRAERGIDDRPYLLYVGRIDPSKGTSWLVDRFIELEGELPADLQLVLVGEPVTPVTDHPRVHVIADAADEERDAAMAGAVALVHPSPYESFGMVVTEAWAQRTPVLALGGNDVLRGHIERSGGGLLFTDRATLGAAATVLTEDGEARDALAEAGQAHVRAEHDWDRVIDRWEHALARTADAPRGRPPVLAPARPLPPTRADEPHRLRERGRVEVRDDLPPAWLARPLALVLGLLAGFCIAGVAAAMAGEFRPAVVVPATLVLGGPIGWRSARALPRWRSTRWTHVTAVVMLALVAAITLLNLDDHSQHVVADRDPGVYVTTAKHLADEGNLLLPGPSGPFVDAPNVSANGAGFSPERDDTTLEAQFPHLTAVVLAAAGWVDDAGIFLATPVVGGFALVCLYAFATLLAGPRWAAVATAVTGIAMPVVIFSRDSYSEPIATALLFGGLWVLSLAERSPRWLPWLLAGLLLGATAMARIDGYLNLAPIALALALHLRLSAGTGRRRLVAVALVVVGVGVAATLGLADTALFTGGYFDHSLAPRLPAMVAAAVVAGVLGLVLGPRLWQRAPTPDDPARRHPTPLLRAGLWAGAAGLVGFVSWGYWIRPDPEGLPEVALEGMRVLDYLPQAKSLSALWLSWYVGPLGLAAGVLGLAVALVALSKSKRPPIAAVAGLAAVLVTTLLYLWTPSVTPDHPWAMRRFAAVAIPGLAVGVAVLARWLWSFAAPRVGGATVWSSARRLGAGALAVVVAAGSVAGTAAATWPVRDVRAQVPMRDRVNQICELAGDDSAILVPIDGILALMFSVPVGVWCDVPSAGGRPGLGPVDVARLAVAWEQEGRRLVVVSSSETPVMNRLLPAGFVVESIETDTVYPRAVEPTIRRKPERVVADTRLGKGPDGEVTFYVYPTDADAARRYLYETRQQPSRTGERYPS
ncbi:MAG TPA: glycosyltransferase family 4 protein [Acidimicrobiales bacterium]|nr:glycosyltransferase family 4 protein [Acidimicrobiales bacterium]